MPESILKNLGVKPKGAHFDKTVSYWMPNDLSVTFGTIFDNMRKWIINDLKGVVKFNHIFVDTQMMGDKDFFGVVVF